MRVVIDTSPLRTAFKHRGISAYTRNLVEALKEVDTNNEYVLTSQPNYVEADIIHYPYFDFFFSTLPYFKPLPTVVTIHDVIPLIYPEHFRPGIRGKLRFIKQKRSLGSVRAIITDSEQSRQDVITYLNQEEHKVHRVYLAAHDSFRKAKPAAVEQVLNKYQLKNPYLLYVGDINYNKNVLGLLKAFAAQNALFDLVLVSRALNNSTIPEAKAIYELINHLQINDRVNILTTVPLDPRDDIQGLYSGANWYIQPSFYEGFGLPVLEAMACRAPVISSIGGSLEELTNGAAITFDPKIPGSMKSALGKALSLSSQERQSYIDKGIQLVSNYSWEKAAKDTIKVYQQVLK